MPYKTGIRLLGVARNPANGFPARLLGWDKTISPINEFIVSQGGVRETDTYNPDFPSAHVIWRIPVESTLAVLQHPGVWSATLWDDGQTERRERPDHEYLNDTANLVLTAWHLGVTAENAAQYALFARGDSVLITMEARNRPDFEELITWLEAHEIYIIDKAKEPTMDGLGNVSSYSTVALIPDQAAIYPGGVGWVPVGPEPDHRHRKLDDRGDAAHKTYLDQARYFALHEAQNVFRRTFSKGGSSRYQQGRINDPGGPFIIAKPKS